MVKIKPKFQNTSVPFPDLVAGLDPGGSSVGPWGAQANADDGGIGGEQGERAVLRCASDDASRAPPQKKHTHKTPKQQQHQLSLSRGIGGCALGAWVAERMA